MNRKGFIDFDFLSDLNMAGIVGAVIFFIFLIATKKWMMDPFIVNMPGIQGYFTMGLTYVSGAVAGYFMFSRMFGD